MNGSLLQRRAFLRLGLTALACTAATPALAALPRPKGIRHLAFHNLHTDEKLAVTYWQDGRYDIAAWRKINHILRDHYSNSVHPIDPHLIDLTHDLQQKLGTDRPIEIISAYRSPITNARLARETNGVAKHSFHTRGMAMDIRIAGTPLSRIHDTALDMGRGGVGYYPDSQFVHIDVGPSRWW